MDSLSLIYSCCLSKIFEGRVASSLKTIRWWGLGASSIVFRGTSRPKPAGLLTTHARTVLFEVTGDMGLGTVGEKLDHMSSFWGKRYIPFESHKIPNGNIQSERRALGYWTTLLGIS